MRGSTVSLSTATSAQITKLFEDPVANYGTIAAYMSALYKKNGIVSGTIRYFSSLLTYNHSIYPTMNEKSKYGELPNDYSEYLEAANFIGNYNIYNYAPYFVRQVLIKGIAFFYKISDKKNVTYMEFPTEWGRVYEMSEDVLKWELDISKLKDDIAESLPNEIAKAYNEYKAGSTKSDKWVDGKWYKLSDKAVAFTLDKEILSNGVAVSEFANLAIDSIQLEKAKDNIEIQDELDTIRILHSKVPTDKDGKPLMGVKTVKIYDNSLKRALPKGIKAVTSPMALENIPLNGAGTTKSFETAKRAQEQMFLATGTPSNLFGGDTKSSNIVKMSVQKDANWAYLSIIPMLESYYNYEFSKFKSRSKMIWKVNILRQSNFNIKEVVDLLASQLSNGGSRLDYLASTGLTPVSAVMKLLMEQQMLNIDSIMIPKSTSFTISGSESESSGDVGRPTTDDPTDDTDRINDSM